MNLKVLLPSQIFATKTDVLRMVVDTAQGSLGLLPQRLDCVAILLPGLLMYQTASKDNGYFALDAGVLIKTGPDVQVSVRRAFESDDLARLQTMIASDYLRLDETERSVRAVSAKLELAFLRRLGALHRD